MIAFVMSLAPKVKEFIFRKEKECVSNGVVDIPDFTVEKERKGTLFKCLVVLALER